jgi:hypothetical protein
MKGGWMIAEHWRSVTSFRQITERCRYSFWRFSRGRPERIVFRRRKTVKLYGTREIDNRDIEQVYNCLEARIEALKQRIQELEAQKETLEANQHKHVGCSRPKTPRSLSA